MTRTGGRDATTAVVPGRGVLSIGDPKTPLAEGYCWTLLSDVARLETGHTPSRSRPEYWNGGIPWIGIRDATGNHGRVIGATQQAISQLGLENSSTRLLPAGTVCLSRTASVGYVIQMASPMCTSQDFVNWVCGDGLVPSYLRYALMRESESVREWAYGSTHRTLYFPEAKAIHIALPSIPRQLAVVEVLGALDDKIAANRRVSLHAEDLAAAIMGKCSKSVRLGDVARQRRSSVSPDRLGTETVLHFSLPAYDAGRAISESASEIKSAKNEIVDPTVLVSKLNPRIPRLWPIDTAASGARRLASTEFVALESSDLTVGELWASILQGNAFGQLQALVGGTSNSHQRVRPQDILDAVVPDPRELRQEDRSALVTLCRLRNQLVEENVILSQTRDELLPLLMNGRITVEDAEKAAESVL